MTAEGTPQVAQPAQRRKWPKWWPAIPAGALVVVVVAAIASSSSTQPTLQRQLPVFAAAKGLVFATADEAAEIAAAMTTNDRRYTENLLIATGDFDLTDMPQDQRTNIYVPYNIRWTAGELGTTVILRQHRGVKQTERIQYTPMYEPLCQMMLDGIAPREACFEPKAKEPGAAKQMQAGLRPATNEEMREWFPRRADEEPFSQNGYFLTTSSVRLAPFSVKRVSAGIVVAPGTLITGGQLEGMAIYDPRTGNKYVDNFCLGMWWQDPDRHDPLNAFSFAPFDVVWRYSQLCS